MGCVPKVVAQMLSAVLQHGPLDARLGVDPPSLPPGADPAPSIDRLWRDALPSTVELRRARRRLHLNAIFVVAVVASGYWALVLSGWPLLARLGAAAALVAGLVAVGTSIMHDANHDSFSTHRWVNRVLAYSSDLLGASSWLWRFQHNTLHHGNANVVGFDADLALAPFARLAPSQPWHRWYRAQHIYIWPLYGFLALKNLLVSDVVALWTRRLDQQPLRQPVRLRVIAQITAGKLAHLTWAVIIPLLFNPWWAVLAFYLACSWLVGFALAITFQVAHCVDVTTIHDDDRSAPRRGRDFAAHQLATTADVATPMPVLGAFFRWLAGGLDHQIEHHLAPRLPHTVYPVVAARFRRACREHGITYRLHPGVWSALRSHARWLRTMSVAAS
jgi:linoleoyl-CoA desaturase